MIRIEDISISYGELNVLESCSLELAEGSRSALMGPSGCGKTTLLNIIAGLVRPQSGSVTVSGSVAYVFQEPRLFPWLTAEQNISLVLEKARAAESLSWLALAGLADCAAKYPDELSGGQQQRVSICRALAAERDILLLDEPLKGLDASLHGEIAGLIRKSSADKTLLLVTHSPGEAELLTDDIYIYNNRRFEREK